jgi:hypothetical protein
MDEGWAEGLSLKNAAEVQVASKTVLQEVMQDGFQKCSEDIQMLAEVCSY